MYKSRSIFVEHSVTQPEWLPRMPARCERHVRRGKLALAQPGFLGHRLMRVGRPLCGRCAPWVPMALSRALRQSPQSPLRSESLDMASYE
jgi:hypothetical protein